jgi:hypothetical protein
MALTERQAQAQLHLHAVEEDAKASHAAYRKLPRNSASQIYLEDVDEL